MNVAYCMLFGLLYAQPVLYLHSELHDIGIDICWYFWFSLKEQLSVNNGISGKPFPITFQTTSICFVLMITGLISWRWRTALWSVFHSILQRKNKKLDHKHAVVQQSVC